MHFVYNLGIFMSLTLTFDLSTFKYNELLLEYFGLNPRYLHLATSEM